MYLLEQILFENLGKTHPAHYVMYVRMMLNYLPPPSPFPIIIEEGFIQKARQIVIVVFLRKMAAL